MKSAGALASLLAVFSLVAEGARADEVFLRVPVGSLDLGGKTLPGPSDPGARPSGPFAWEFPEALGPQVVLDGPGEAYFDSGTASDGRPGIETVSALEGGAIVIRLPQLREVKGRIHSPQSGASPYRFTIQSPQPTADAREAFYRTRLGRCENLASRGLPGAAWFRHEAGASRKALGGTGVEPGGARPGPFGGASELEDTYLLFSGGKAISENLQLDRVLRPTSEGDLSVDVSTLTGITTAAIDWKPLVKDLKPAMDPLASCIPADQHALFFPSFQAMVEVMDEADAQGTPILQLLEPRAEDARTRQRYERQLALGMSDVARLLGPAAVESVAFTGSDPYLRTGTDVAVLFQARAPEALKGYVSSKHAAAAKDSAVKTSRGEVEGLEYTAAISPDRVVSSYLLVHEKTVVVTNSLAQLRSLAETMRGRRPALASSEEYSFFRDRYRRGDPEETAFLILTDATIRRWCGPVWRIGDSRRTRAAAILAELQASKLEALASGDVTEGPLETSLAVPGAGAFRLTRRGPVSEAYGSLEFLTPIAELDIEKATKEEAGAYEQFRRTYQQNWRQFFDPIAVRLTTRGDRLAADLTVMPLIEGTEYRELIQVTRGVDIPPAGGDPHPEAIFQVIFAVNKDSEPVKELGKFASVGLPGLKTHPLAWLGDTVSFYADGSPAWAELERAKDEEKRFEVVPRLPLALHCDVKDPFGLTAFLATLRSFIEGSAPGLTVWETLRHRDMPYVKVTASEAAKSEAHSRGVLESLALYYAAAAGSLTFTFDEEVLRRALDRQSARADATKEDNRESAVRPAADLPAWLGKSVAARVKRQGIAVLSSLGGESYRAANARKSWENLPILNEWKRLYPAEDPVKLHERLWGARLLCPGGGSYVWNEEWHTMESTAYGHPAKPKDGPTAPSILETFSSAGFGLTFEKQGLRAAMEVERAASKP